MVMMRITVSHQDAFALPVAGETSPHFKSLNSLIDLQEFWPFSRQLSSCCFYRMKFPMMLNRPFLSCFEYLCESEMCILFLGKMSFHLHVVETCHHKEKLCIDYDSSGFVEAKVTCTCNSEMAYWYLDFCHLVHCQFNEFSLSDSKLN